MRKVKYIYKQNITGLTIGKVYDVIKYDSLLKFIVIINDNNEKISYPMFNASYKDLFIEAIIEARNDVIDEILS